jgi:hypothetical protein
MRNGHLSRLSAAVLLIGQASAWGYPSGIQLVSEQHHVWGYAGSETMYGPGGTQVPYDQTSSGPLYVSATGTYMDPYMGEWSLTAWSSAGNFSSEALSTYWFSRAHGESTYVFLPEAGTGALTFTLSGSGDGVGLPESHIGFTLADLTTGVSLASLLAPADADWHEWSTWSYNWTETHWMDPTHTYVMTLSASAEGGDGTRHAILGLDVRPAVPAPGALLLAAIGVACLGWRRRSPAR